MSTTISTPASLAERRRIRAELGRLQHTLDQAADLTTHPDEPIPYGLTPAADAAVPERNPAAAVLAQVREHALHEPDPITRYKALLAVAEAWATLPPAAPRPALRVVGGVR